MLDWRSGFNSPVKLFTPIMIAARNCAHAAGCRRRHRRGAVARHALYGGPDGADPDGSDDDSIERPAKAEGRIAYKIFNLLLAAGASRSVPAARLVIKKANAPKVRKCWAKVRKLVKARPIAIFWQGATVASLCVEGGEGRAHDFRALEAWDWDPRAPLFHSQLGEFAGNSALP